MARQVLPIVGAIVGSFFGAPQLGFAIGSIIGNVVDPQVIKGPRIGEAGLQTSAEGVFRPYVRGLAAVKGNVIQRGNRQVKTERHSQGKGGPEVEEQRVYWTFAIRVCEGPIQGITRIWMDEKLVYDVTPGSTIPEETADFASGMRVHLGTETQLPDPDLEAFKGAGNVNAYRGTAYVVFPNFDLTDRRESIPDFRFEVLADGALLAWDYTWDFVAEPIIGGVGNSKPAFGNGMLLYASNQGVQKTTNGTTWSSMTSQPFDSIAFWPDAGLFVATKSYYPSTVAVSNGVDAWVTLFAENIPGGGAVCCPDDLEYALSLGAGPETPYCLVITEEGTVTPHELGAGPRFVKRLIRSERLGLFIAICQTDLPPEERIWFSTTGLESTWFTYGGDYDTDWEDVIDVPEHGLVYFVGNVLTTTGGTTLVTTPDMVAFTDKTPPSIPNRNFSGATYIPASNQVVIAPRSFFGGYSDFLTTTNGEDFELHGLYPNGNFTSPQWAGAPINKIVAISTGGLLGDGALLSNSSMETGLALSEVVAGLHGRVNQPASEYDVSELTDSVLGIVFAGDYSCADAVRTLMQPYFFDASEYDDGTGYRIHYPKRGKPVVRTLTIDDLLDLPEKTVREDSLERPRVLHLHYENPTVGYVPAKATDRRDSLDVKVVGERSVQIPVVMDDVDEPARIVRKLMKVLWTEVAGEQEFVVSDNHLDLVPGDAVGVSLRNITRRMRIAQQQIGSGEMRLSLIADRQSAYTANVTGIPVPPPTPPLPSIAGVTLFEYLDIPALNDNNDRLLYYTSATGESPAWYGAVIQRKNPGASAYEEATTFNAPTVMGELLEDVPAASEHYPDRTNVVHLRLYRPDELQSITEVEWLSEGNAFALENADGSWEVMQFQTAEQDSAGDWALSGLMRGRLNTGGHAHPAGARFVLLDGVRSVDATVAWLNQDLTHRAVSLGTSPETATPVVDQFTGASQREFPVAHLFLDVSGSTLTAQAVPRHRFGTEDHPVRSANWTGYRWTVSDGASTITRDGLASTEAFDVSGMSGPIIVTVAQLNRFTGPGPTVSESTA